MPLDNRKILRTVRLSGATPASIASTVRKFKTGQEDELAAALTPAQGAAYLASGTLSGDWEFTGGEQQNPAEEAPGAEPNERRQRLAAAEKATRDDSNPEIEEAGAAMRGRHLRDTAKK